MSADVYLYSQNCKITQTIWRLL